ncbi:nephrin-like isoform X2 [Dreissena polymorpha]|uniref:nephrin-like isoform X2 n=1 Tax=Dreissena polymorpha TaxID=45954 RepID=UPI0022644C43|nr:nephrin-like isoform X2 [Dreissena polymorpha]
MEVKRMAMYTDRRNVTPCQTHHGITFTFKMKHVFYAYLLGFAVGYHVAFGQVTLTPNTTMQAEYSSLQLRCTLQPHMEDVAVWRRRSFGAATEINILFIAIRGADQCDYDPPTPPSFMSCSCRSREYTCIIKGLTRDQDGDQWRCRSTNPDGQQVFSTNVTLHILIQISSVTISPSSDTVRVVENSDQTFTCKTSWGKPAATVTWYKSSEIMGSSEVAITTGIVSSQSIHQDRTIQVTSTLTYTASRTDNGYRVFCDATNGGVAVQSTTRPQLDILYLPSDGPVIQALPGAGVYKMIRGSSTQQRLTCSVTGGYPLPTLSWNCYDGTHNGSTQGDIVSLTVYWTADMNVDSTCTCTAFQSGSTWTRNKSVSVTVLYSPSRPSCSVGSATVTNGTVRVIRGKKFDISCSAIANPSPTYIWTTPPDGNTVNNPELSVPNIQTGGTYSLSVRNIMEPTTGEIEYGFANSTFNIDILESPSVPIFYYGTSSSGTVIPNNHLDVIIGTQFSVTCVATGNPSPTYTWSGISQTWSTTAQTNLTKTCSVVNTLNQTGYNIEPGTRQENQLNLTVMFPPGVIECTVGSSRFTSGLVNVLRNKAFNIRCDSTSFPAPYNYTWTLPNGGIRMGPELRVNSIQAVLTSQYRVTVNNIMVPSVGQATTGTNSTILDIQLLYPPGIQSGIRIQGDSTTSRVNDSYISTVENSTFTLSFDVMPGYPAATIYTWVRRSGGISTNNQAITFTRITRAKADYYNFTALNHMKPTGFALENGTTSIDVYINVKYRSAITAFYANPAQGNITVEVSEGTPLKLTCVTDSNPWPDIALTRNGVVVQENASVRQIEYNKPSSSCENDVGEYTCLSQNELNPSADKRTLRYYVLCTPRLSPFIQHSANVTGSLHSSADISVTMIAYPAPTYTWQKLNDSGWKEIETSSRVSIVTSVDRLQSNVSISDIQEADFGSYRVIAKNSQGEIPIVLYFQVSSEPEPVRNLQFIEGSLTENSAVIMWSPGFDGGNPQTFLVLFKRRADNEWSAPMETTVANITLTGLQPGTDYQVKVLAENSIGSSEHSEPISFTTLIIEKPNNAALIGGAIGGVIGAALILVVVVLGVRKCRQVKDSANKSVCETTHTNTVYNRDYDELSQSHAIRYKYQRL